MSSLAASLTSNVNVTKSLNPSIYSVLSFKMVTMKSTHKVVVKMKSEEISENVQHSAGHKISAR